MDYGIQNFHELPYMRRSKFIYSLNECNLAVQHIFRNPEGNKGTQFSKFLTLLMMFVGRSCAQFQCVSGECLEWKKTCRATFNCEDASDNPELCGKTFICYIQIFCIFLILHR